MKNMCENGSHLLVCMKQATKELEQAISLGIPSKDWATIHIHLVAIHQQLKGLLHSKKEDKNNDR